MRLVSSDMHRVVIIHGNEIRSVPFALTDDVFRIVIRGMQILPTSISDSDQIVRIWFLRNAL